MESIEQNVEIAAAAERVYEALTTTKGYKGWWTNDCEVGAKVGELAAFRFNPMGGGPGTMEVRFRIDALKPREAVELVCVGHENNPDWQGTRVAFHLAAAGKGTRLAFAHTGFASRTPTYEACIKGWQHFLASLQKYAETGTGTPMVR